MSKNSRSKQKKQGAVATTGFSILSLFINLLASNSIVLIFLIWIYFQNKNNISLDIQNLKYTFMDLVPQLRQNGYLVSISVISGAIFAILFIWGIGITQNVKNIFEYLDIKRFRKKDFFIWFFIYLIFMIGSEFVGPYFNRPKVPEFMYALICNPGSYILLFCAVAIFAPLFEEVLFRGYWFSGFLNNKPGAFFAILVPNLVWASIHLQYDLYDITQIFIIGIILGASRYFSGSLLLPILLHTMQNSVAFFASLYVINCN